MDDLFIYHNCNPVKRRGSKQKLCMARQLSESFEETALTPLNKNKVSFALEAVMFQLHTSLCFHIPELRKHKKRYYSTL